MTLLAVCLFSYQLIHPQVATFFFPGNTVVQTQMIRAVVRSDVSAVRRLLVVPPDLAATGVTVPPVCSEPFFNNRRVSPVLACMLKRRHVRLSLDGKGSPHLFLPAPFNPHEPKSETIAKLLIDAGCDVWKARDRQPLDAFGYAVQLREADILRSMFEAQLRAGPSSLPRLSITLVLILMDGSHHFGFSGALELSVYGVMDHETPDSLLLEESTTAESAVVGVDAEGETDTDTDDLDSEFDFEEDEDDVQEAAQRDAFLATQLHVNSQLGLKAARDAISRCGRPGENVALAYSLCVLQPTTAATLSVLLEHSAPGAVVDDVDPDTVLHRHSPIILDATEEHGLTSLMYAARVGDGASITALAGAGAALDVQASDGNFGWTALHYAVARGWTDAVKALLDVGADPNVKDTAGRTPQDVAALHGFHNIVSVFTPETAVDTSSPLCADSGVCAVPAATPVSEPSDGNGDRTDSSWPGVPDEEDVPDVFLPLFVDPAGGACAIDAVSAADVSPDAVLRDYLSVGKPVVLRGAASEWGLRSLFTPQYLSDPSQVAADVEVEVGQIPYPRQHAHPGGSLKIREFTKAAVGGGAPEVLQRVAAGLTAKASKTNRAVPLVLMHSDVDSLLDTMVDTEMEVIPPHLASLNMSSISTAFGLGGVFAGAPMHFHSPGYSALLHGRRRWQVRPPSTALASRSPAVRWFGIGNEDDKATDPAFGPSTPSACVSFDALQAAGDIVFVPDSWGSSFINLAPSVSVSAEFDSDLFPHF